MLERVQKIISNAGYCSRRKAEDLIRAGKVKVNGKTVAIGASADREKDIVLVDGKRLRFSRKVYFLLNKPKGYVCSRDDPIIKKSVYDIVRTPEKVYTVGRLDVLSEGLIILTNDGDFANHVMHPRYEVAKTYQVRLDKEFNILGHKHRVENGMVLRDKLDRPFKTGKMHLSVDPKDKKNIYLTLHEGKNRIVRRIFERLGYKLFQLVRVRIGNIRIEGLDRGRSRELTKEEIAGLVQRN